MKYCIMSYLQLVIPAKRDMLSDEIKTFIGGKVVWGAATVTSDIDEKGQPYVVTVVRFEAPSNMDDLFSLIKDRIDRIPVLKGWVSKHNCDHDEGVSRPCIITEKYEKA